MATRKALVMINGQLQEMPAGDTLEGAGVGGGSNFFTANISLDFGNDGALSKVTIFNSVITNANFKGAHFLWVPTINHHETYEDYILENLQLSVENIVDNSSFEVVGFAPHRTWGMYEFKVIINY